MKNTRLNRFLTRSAEATVNELIIMLPGSENNNTANCRLPSDTASGLPQPFLCNSVLAVPFSPRDSERILRTGFRPLKRPGGSLQDFQIGLPPAPVSFFQLPVPGVLGPGPADPQIDSKANIFSVETRADISPKFKIDEEPIGDFRPVFPLQTAPTTPRVTDAAPVEAIPAPVQPLPDVHEMPVELPETVSPALPAPSTTKNRKPIRLSDHVRSSGPVLRARPKKEPKKQTCKCKKTFCIRLYCVCFAGQGYCGKDCTCQSCLNQEEHLDVRNQVIEETLAKNPLAFASKFKKINREKKVILHARGCNCKKTGCMKQYCECYKAKTGCTRLCRCTDCKNDFIELTMEEVKANYEPVQRKRRRSANSLRIWATKAALDRSAKK